MLVCALDIKPGSVTYMTLTGGDYTDVVSVDVNDDSTPQQVWRATILDSSTTSRLDLRLEAVATVLTPPPGTRPPPAPGTGPTAGNVTITLNTGGSSPGQQEQALDVPYVND